MTYDELKQIAQPHIRKGGNFPSNAFLLLVQLHIPFKTKTQCEADYGGKMNPLYNTPAFLSINNTGDKTIYFNPDTKYCDFYVFHEVSHYILGHENDSPQNEMDADMLACVLMAPVENFPSTIKSARDVSTICGIPIDKAEMYWQEVKKEVFPRQIKVPFVIGGIITLILLGIMTFYMIQNRKVDDIGNAFIENRPTTESIMSSTVPMEPPTQPLHKGYYVTIFGERYHEEYCRYLKDKTNITYMPLNEAEEKGLKPCKVCIDG